MSVTEHIGWLKMYIDGMTADNWADMRLQCKRQLNDLTAALSGMVVVPGEPTPEMIAAWYRHKNGFHFADGPPPRDTSDYGAYRAMIAAAQPARSPKGNEDV